MMRNRLVLCLLMVLLLLPIPIGRTQSEETCPSLVKTALNQVDSVCASTGRNQACYGNTTLTAESQARVERLIFDTPGDIVDAAHLHSLTLSPLDETAGEWGISLMKLQANLPDTLPGQNVTLLLFGDVNIENRVKPEVTVELQVSTGANIRSLPYSDRQNVIGSLAPGTQVTATGRTVNGAGETWIRIHYEEYASRTGWIIGWALAGNIDALTEIEPTTLALNTMQAFYFQSGIGDAPCTEAPESGILVQTPKGAGTVSLVVNGVDINLASTVFLQAEPGAYMLVNTLEGRAIIRAAGVSRTVPAGAMVVIPLDNAGVAAGPPEFPQPYDYDRLQALPVNVSLPESVEIIPALEHIEVETAAPVETSTTQAEIPAPAEANTTQAETTSPSGASVTVVVPGASSNWTSTGIHLQPGTRYSVSASGTVNYGGPSIGPAGNAFVGGSEWPVPGVRDIALAGRIGGSRGFFLGTGGTFTAQSDGELQLIVNDNIFSDNSGEFVVTIQVKP